MNIPTIPNNSLTEEIIIVVESCNNLKDEYYSEFFAPVTEDQLLEWENQNKITMPESYKDWLRFSNGAIIRDFLARLYDIKNIEINNKDYPDDLVIIGELIGDGERLCFSKSTGKIIRINHGDTREYNDFKTFLLRMVIRMLNR